MRRACRGSASARWLAALLVLVAVFGAPAGARAGHAPGDPLESFNRAVFKFNDTLDVWLLEPVAKCWDFLVPDPAERAVDRFMENLRFPVIFANALLQGKPTAASTAFGRFTVNTLLGLGGFLDPAASAGMEPVDEDFGQTLGRWGVGGGPYLVLPLLGPSNVRDAVGLAADSAARVWPYFVDEEVVWAVGAVGGINTRSLLIDTIEMAKRDSLDYYAAVRDAYLQRRDAQVEDKRSSKDDGVGEEDLYYPELDDDDLYYLEEEDD